MTATVAVLLGAGTPAWSQKLPSGGAVAAGSVTIAQPNSSTLNINQSTNQAIINWNTFSVGRGDTVNFNQPNSSSATLNRVTGSTPSWIAGTINAPGTVLLVNPNGIEITKSGVVNAGSFAASTLGIKDADFLAGRYSFSGNGGSAGVINNGRINVSDGGFAALLGGQVANNGVISARLGTVALGAGEQATLDLSGDGFLSVAVPSSELGKLVNGNGALVSNNGKINANGGTVFLSAAAAANILRNAVNIPGSIRTNSVGTRNGRIVINGGGGNVSITGRLAANGGKTRKGGNISVTGQNVSVTGALSANGANGGSISLTSSNNLWVSGTASVQGFAGSGGLVDLSGSAITLARATIDASGTTGGGLVRIGGTFQGGNGDPTSALYESFIGRYGALPAIASAQTVSVDAASAINVSATKSGDAGTAVIWSEQSTSFAGNIVGTGGPNGGNGGFAEVSSHGVLGFAGTADLLAPGGGAIGTLLLDPFSVTIAAGTGGTINSGSFNATANSTIGATTLDSALSGGNVIISTGTTGSGAGSITLNSGVILNWSSGSTLTLNASNKSTGTITLTGSITPSNGSLTLEAGSNGGIADTGTLSVNTFTLASGNWSQIASTLPSFSANNFVLSGGSFLRALGGSGTIASPYQITDVYGLQGMGTMLSSNFSLANNISASGTVNWNSGAGFIPIGFSTSPDYSCSSGCFTGTLNGNGFTISNLFVNQPSSGGPAGLFGLVNYTGTGNVIQNLNLTGLNITGGALAGGLAGYIYNGNISSVSTAGTVSTVSTGTGFEPPIGAGGLIGAAGGDSILGLVGTVNVTNSSSSATVTASSATNTPAGGIAGEFVAGTISNSYTTGNITGGANVAGLVAYGGGTIFQSYATGQISQTNDQSLGSAGGLVGYSSFNISQSFATGAVSGFNQASVGGIAGSNFGIITDSYATGAVTLTNDGHSSSGVGNAGGLVGFQEGTINNSFATGLVTAISSAGLNNLASGSISVGGLVGTDFGSVNTITNSYFDKQTTNQSVGIGYSNPHNSATGLLTSELQAGLPTGFNTTANGGCAACWGIIPGQTYPFLLWQPGVVSGTVYATFGGVPVGAGVTVQDIINGTAGSSVLTDSNGNYLFFLGTIPSGANVLTYTSGGVSYAQNAGSSVSGLNIYGTYLSETTPVANASSLATGLTAAIGGNAALQTQVNGLANRLITPTGTSFAIDQTINTGILVLSTSGATAITQSAAIAATSLDLQGTGASTYTLTNTGNQVGTLAANLSTGTISFTDSMALNVGSVAGTNGISTGTLTISDTGGSISQSQIVTTSGGASFTTSASNATIALGLNNQLSGAVSLNTSGNSGNATLVNATATQLAASTVGGNLSVTDSTGNLTQTGVLTVGGTSSFTTSAANATIALTQANLLTGAVSLGTNGSTGNASLTNNQATQLAASSVGGNLSVTDSTGNLTETGVLTVGGMSSFTTSASNATITLTQANQLTGAVSLNTSGTSGAASLTNNQATVLAASNIGGALTVIDSVGNVTQTGILTIAGTSSFTTSAANATITLGSNNLLTGGVSLNTNGSTGNASLTNNKATVLAASNVGGNLSVTDSTGNLTQTGVLTVGGTSSFKTSASNATIALTQTNQLTGTVSLNTTGSSGAASLTNNLATTLATSSVGGNLSVTDSTGNLTQTGVLTVGGTSSFTTSAANATIGLDSQTNQLTGAVTLNTSGSSGNANLTNGKATQLAASSVGGNLTVTDTTGNLTQSGVLTVGGTSSFTTQGTGTITLNSANLLTGAVSLNTAGSSAASLTNNQSLLLGISTVGGNLTVADSVGNLTQTGILTVAGTSSFKTSASNATITLGSANLLTGAVTLGTAGTNGNASLTNGKATTLAASTVGGSLTVASSSDLSVSGPVSAKSDTLTSGGNLTIASAGRVSSTAGDVVLSATGNFVNNEASNAIVATGGRWLVYSSAPGTDTFGTSTATNLNSNNAAIWGATYTTLPPASVTASGNHYIFAFQPTLTVTSTGTLTKTYGQDATAAVAGSSYTVSGLQAGVTNAFLADTNSSVFSGTPTLTSLGMGTSANASATPYGITVNTGSLTALNGYAFAAVNNGTLTVNQATITLSGTRTYDSTTAFSASTFNGGTIAGVNGETLSLTGAGSVLSANVSAGAQTLTLGSLALGNGTGLASNYQIASGGNTGTVTAATVTLSGSRTYDSTTAFTGSAFNIATGINGETLTLSGTGSVANSNVSAGTQTLALGSLALANGTGLASNYVIAKGGNTGTITAATVTLNGSKTYDSTTAFTGSAFNVATGINGETLTLTGSGSVVSANVSAGAQTLTLGSLALANGTGLASNYQIATSGNTGTITAATVTLNGSKSYDSTTAFTGSAFNVATGINGETLSLTGSGSVVSANVSAGAQTLTLGSLALANGTGLASNYQIASSGNTGTITAATVTLSGSKSYDSTTAFAGSAFNIATGINGETLTLTGSGSVVSANVSAGTQALTLGSLALANGTGLASNYQIANSGNTGTVTAATVTLSGSKTYDSTTAFAASSFGTVATGINGETLSLTGAGSVASANVSAGTQTLTLGSLALANGTGLASNYQIATSGNTGAITAATVTLSGSKTYDSTTAFTGSAFNVATGINGETLTLTGAGSVVSANVSAGTQTLALGSLALANGTGLASNYQIASSGNTGTITAATVTLNDSKTYDSTTAFTGSAFNVATGINGETLTLTGTGSVANSNVSAGTQTLALGSLALADGTGLASNYVIAKGGNTGTITAATVTLNGIKTYDSTTAFAASAFGTVATGINGETLNLTGLGSVANSNVNAGSQTLTLGSLALANGTGLASNYQITAKGNTGTVTPEAVQITAVTNTKTYDGTTSAANVPTVTGGTLYAIDGANLSESYASPNVGTGLTLNTNASFGGPNGNTNYVITYVANTTGVISAAASTPTTPTTQSSNPPSQFVSTINGNTPNNVVNINFQTPNTATASSPVRIAFTPNSPTSTASNQNDVSTAALGINAFTRNHGLDFLPISQYDANQYSQFKLPDYDDRDGQATVFTIIARAVAHDKAADFMIDGFWNGTASDWTGANGKNPVNAKVTYSDGAGHDVTPSDAAAFPIVAGKTDFAQLLKNGPVMIGGAPAKVPANDASAPTPADGASGHPPAGSTPSQTSANGTPAPAPVGWLLALNLTADGKGIVCDDPITGKLVVLAYNQVTRTLGGITSIFDAKTKGFVALADASGDIPASVGGVAALQGFVPATFFAVTVH